MAYTNILIQIENAILITYLFSTCYSYKSGLHYGLMTLVIIAENIVLYSLHYEILLVIVLLITLLLFQWMETCRVSITKVIISIFPINVMMFSNVFIVLGSKIFLCHLMDITIQILALPISVLIGRYYGGDIGEIKRHSFTRSISFVIILLFLLTNVDLYRLVKNINLGILVYFRIIVFTILILVLYQTIYQKKKGQTNTAGRQAYIMLHNENMIRENKQYIDRLEHNLKYLLLTILFHAKNNDIKAIQEHASSYLGKVMMTNHAIVTNNPYFDYIFNALCHEYKGKGMDLKKNICFFEQSAIDPTVSNQITLLTRQILDLALMRDLMTVDIKITEDDNFCFFRFILPYQEYRQVQSIEQSGRGFVVIVNEEFKVVRLSLSIDI